MRFLNEKLQALTPYTPGEQSQETIIKLNTNENPYPPSPAVLKAAATAAKQLNRYSDPECLSLVQALAKHYQVAPSQVFVGNGSDDVLSLLFEGFMEKGVSYPEITYGFYQVYQELYQLSGQKIPLNNALQIQLTDYQAQEGTVIFANPNAPTGLGISPVEIVAFAKKNPHRLIIVDEAYGDFGTVSVVPYLKEASNLLVVGTFSKSRQLAGLRIGFALGDPSIIADLNTLKFSHNPYSVNQVAIACGTASLEDDAYVRQTTQQLITTREVTTRALEKLNFKVIPSQANFLFVTHENMDANALFQWLKTQRIFVRWFDHPQIQQYLRISIGTDEEMAQLVSACKQYMEANGL